MRRREPCSEYDRGVVDGYDEGWRRMFATHSRGGESNATYWDRIHPEPIASDTPYHRGFESGIRSAFDVNTKVW